MTHRDTQNLTLSHRYNQTLLDHLQSPISSLTNCLIDCYTCKVLQLLYSILTIRTQVYLKSPHPALDTPTKSKTQSAAYTKIFPQEGRVQISDPMAHFYWHNLEWLPSFSILLEYLIFSRTIANKKILPLDKHMHSK